MNAIFSLDRAAAILSDARGPGVRSAVAAVERRCRRRFRRERRCAWRRRLAAAGERRADPRPDRRHRPARGHARPARRRRGVGAGLAAMGLTVVCGGRQGVMEATCRGAARGGGLTIGILPDADPAFANPFVGVVLATGIGEARNALIARASFCLIAIGDSLRHPVRGRARPPVRQARGRPRGRRRGRRRRARRRRGGGARRRRSVRSRPMRRPAPGAGVGGSYTHAGIACNDARSSH